jgi:hypothetical protein
MVAQEQKKLLAKPSKNTQHHRTMSSLTSACIEEIKKRNLEALAGFE